MVSKKVVLLRFSSKQEGCFSEIFKQCSFQDFGRGMLGIYHQISVSTLSPIVPIIMVQLKIGLIERKLILEKNSGKLT